MPIKTRLTVTKDMAERLLSNGNMAVLHWG